VAFLYPLLTAALFYLGSRATITSWLWNRYPSRLANFMDCSACTGFWYGLLLETGLGGWRPFLGVGDYSVIFVGLCSIVWTPIVAALMQHSLFILGTVVLDEPPPLVDPLELSLEPPKEP